QAQSQGFGARREAFLQGRVGEHDQGAAGGGGPYGGEEGVRGGQVEEEGGERVDGGGEPAFGVRVEPLPLGIVGGLPVGAAGNGTPGARRRIGSGNGQAAEDEARQQDGSRGSHQQIPYCRASVFSRSRLAAAFLSWGLIWSTC